MSFHHILLSENVSIARVNLIFKNLLNAAKSFTVVVEIKWNGFILYLVIFQERMKYLLFSMITIMHALF